MKDPVYGAFTAITVHAFKSIPLVMSRYWYALESVRRHNCESSIHSRAVDCMRPTVLFCSVLVENGTKWNGTGNFFW